MEIEKIFHNHIYSIKYDNHSQNEYDRLISIWNDWDFVFDFLEKNKQYLSNDIWKKTPTPEEAAEQIFNEAAEIECTFNSLFKNTIRGKKPDFDNHFQPLGGKYGYTIFHCPMKSYGRKQKPAFLRLYAIKLEMNTYLITGGGIKLNDKIENSPDLDHVITEIDAVSAWLTSQGIIDKNDI